MATVRQEPRHDPAGDPPTLDELRSDAEARIRAAQSSLALIVNASYPADPALIDTIADLLHQASKDARGAGEEFVRTWRLPQ